MDSSETAFLHKAMSNILYRNDLKNIFAPLITDILRLIDDQVKSVKIKRPDHGVTVSKSLLSELSSISLSFRAFS